MILDKRFVQELKVAILQSRFQAARMANKELLLLYMYVGYRIDYESKKQAWGSKVLQNISSQLQNELQGLRGFSPENLKKMRVFANFWLSAISKDTIGSMLSNQILISDKNADNQYISFIENISHELGSIVSNQFRDLFFSVGFSHHFSIASASKSVEEALFYINKTAREFWSYQALLKHLKSELFRKTGILPNNFGTTLPLPLSNKALNVFKDEYLLDFINVQDAYDEDEYLIETGIVRNIRQFIMTIGQGFAFIGNQYRLKVEDQEYFIDLLFFNRQLQSLVAFELKNGTFKPEYLGKMNFYLSALDDLVRQPHENPSIGIILCKEKKNTIVEYSFRDFSKPMGVAIFTTSAELPERFKGILPEPGELKNLFKN
jgi:predicted nuclease of restriction endonuclease-like (RecB) superfamily